MGALLALALVAVLGACAPRSDDAASADPPDDAVVVASMNFAESRLLAEIYAQALEAVGIAVHRELALGPRELVHPALVQGLVDLVPEYLGTALATVDPGATVDMADAAAVRRALARAVAAWDLVLLEPAPAQNRNGLVVPAATAGRYGLSTVSDLTRVASTMVLGGPPECPTRPLCMRGFADVYGLRFADFVPFADQARLQRALEEAVVDVGVLFTTDGVLATDDLVLLEDDRALQPAEHVVPVVRRDVVARHGDELVERLDGVSALLTTEALRVLNWRVQEAGGDPAQEAHGWLVRQGLVPRPEPTAGGAA